MTSAVASPVAIDETRRRRRARVEGLREAIRSGRYFVSAEDVARRLSRRLVLLRLPPGPQAQTR
jgi:anti-sigma28 factor (negative regulator of flagellin synthesis)